MKSVFEVTFSPEGHNMRKKEIDTYVYFCDFMDECEGIMILQPLIL